jgi:DNA-binding response OmpR family regulator
MAARQRILVVDDEPQICDVVELYLRREGFEVATAHDGESALNAVEHDPPDLVVLDVMMPKVNGLEVTRLVHERFNIPIIMLTSRGEEQGCSVLEDPSVTKHFIKIHTVIKKFKADIFHLVFA